MECVPPALSHPQRLACDSQRESRAWDRKVQLCRHELAEVFGIQPIHDHAFQSFLTAPNLHRERESALQGLILLDFSALWRHYS